jgi:hypothetical protein
VGVITLAFVTHFLFLPSLLRFLPLPGSFNHACFCQSFLPCRCYQTLTLYSFLLSLPFFTRGIVSTRQPEPTELDECGGSDNDSNDNGGGDGGSGNIIYDDTDDDQFFDDEDTGFSSFTDDERSTVGVSGSSAGVFNINHVTPHVIEEEEEYTQ